MKNYVLNLLGLFPNSGLCGVRSHHKPKEEIKGKKFPDLTENVNLHIWETQGGYIHKMVFQSQHCWHFGLDNSLERRWYPAVLEGKGHPEHCKRFSSMPDSLPLEASSTSFLPKLWQQKISPYIAKRAAKWGKIAYWDQLMKHYMAILKNWEYSIHQIRKTYNLYFVKWKKPKYSIVMY